MQSTQQERLQNYLEYYERIEPIRYYTLEELQAMSVEQLLEIMPQNQTQEKFSEAMQRDISDYIACFKLHKIIDGSWRLGYYEGHRNKATKDQRTLFELTYVRDLKAGLVEVFLWVQQRGNEYMENIRSGRKKLYLDEGWGDRKGLGLE